MNITEAIELKKIKTKPIFSGIKYPINPNPNTPHKIASQEDTSRDIL